MTDKRKAVPSAELIALLDDPKIAAAVRVPGETADRLLYGSPGREQERGLFTRQTNTTPLPPSTMTRQQRRYLARKGRRND